MNDLRCGNLIFPTFIFLILGLINPLYSQDVDDATWDSAVNSVKQISARCSNETFSDQRKHIQCVHCGKLANHMGQSHTAPNKNLLTQARQCEEIFTDISAEQSTPNISSKKTKSMPETPEAIAADLRQFAKEFRMIADNTKGPQRAATNSAKSCNAYADKILKQGINPTTKEYWPFCYRNLNAMKNKK